MNHRPRLIAFDLDGTLTQHRTPMGEQSRSLLDKLRAEYKLIMVGAGACARIHKQMGGYPIDIIGNYGMQFAEFNVQTGQLELRFSETVPVDHDEVVRRAGVLRDKFGLHAFKGDTIEIHATGMLTFPLLGTQADIADKLACDPDRSRRKAMYDFVKALFYDYHVMIGGSSSFDIVPKQYGKLNALIQYMKDHNLAVEDVLYCGDDYGVGGNDQDVYEGGIPFAKVDSYLETESILHGMGII